MGATTRPSCGRSSSSAAYVPDLVNAVLDLLVDEERGIWHLANQGTTSWSDLAERVAAEAGLSWRAKPRLIDGDAPITALSTERGLIMPRLEDAIARYFQEREVPRRAFLQAAE
jgi:dTDP-4-dehydrorhamnose reductase